MEMLQNREKKVKCISHFYSGYQRGLFKNLKR
jgi:hypothetical protein